MNELVKINDNNQVTTDSLTVADRFGKRHCDVLRSIKLLKCSKDFNARNFASVEYKDQKGEKRTYYDMTQDGWMFLVMGFTGEKAAEWKEKFIVAFRAMEAELRKRQDKLVIVSEHNPFVSIKASFIFPNFFISILILNPLVFTIVVYYKFLKLAIEISI